MASYECVYAMCSGVMICLHATWSVNLSNHHGTKKPWAAIMKWKETGDGSEISIAMPLSQQRSNYEMELYYLHGEHSRPEGVWLTKAV